MDYLSSALSALMQSLGGKAAGLVVYAAISLFVVPVLAVIISRFIMNEAKMYWDIPLEAIVAFVLTLLVSFLSNRIVARWTGADFRHVTVVGAVLVLQILICYFLVPAGLLSSQTASAVVLGSVVMLLITIIRRPSTYRKERKEKAEGKSKRPSRQSFLRNGDEGA